VLRAWLAGAGLRAVASRRLEDLRAQLLTARTDGALCVRLPGAQVRRYRAQAWIEVAGQPEVGPADCLVAVSQFDPGRPEVQRVDVAEWGGALLFSPAQADGIGTRILQARLSLTARRGGERIVLRPGGPSRALKQAYQEARIPAWARARLPLLYAGDRLVFAAGLGLDRSAVAAGPGWCIAWLQARGGGVPGAN
ncbi:tRNA lysidine(34) synthetase TilS, partial [Ralstonia solanacearum]